MMHRVLKSVLAASLACAVGGCQLHPRPIEAGNEILPPPPTPAMPYHVSDMRIQVVGAQTFLYSPHTSFQDMPGPVAETIGSLQRLASSGQIRQAGPILLIYHDPTENPAEPFDLDVGVSVSDAKLSPPADFQVRRLPPFHCATAIYRGPMKLLPKAYDQLIPGMIAVGLIPSEETRESYLVWESPDSPNNVVQIEVGIR